MLGALGSATEVGIGLAMELPDKHVYVVDGDGSFFFSPNQLLDLVSLGPANLTVICLDNGSWGSTGNQPTLSAQGMNLSAMAQSVGILRVGMTDDPAKLAEMMKTRQTFIHCMIQAGNNKTAKGIPLSAVEIKVRFMKSV
jgi:sulfopyruvate decarboxylase subunit beta